VPSSTVRSSFGETVASAVKAQKLAFQKEGRAYKLADLAVMVDALLPAYLERYPYNGKQEFCLESPTEGLESPLRPFGDPKAIPPSPGQVTAYSAFIGYPLDGQAWCDSYAVKDWKVGRVRMKDWQAAVRTWKANRYGQDGIALKNASAAPINSQPKDYSKI
jgi:hypothetical protein